MSPNPFVTVQVDLSRVRQNVQASKRRAGVPVIGVVKADAYGLGAEPVAKAIADEVDAFYVFDAAEAILYGLPALGRRIIAMLSASDDPNDYLPRHIQPVVWTESRAKALRAAHPILSVDVGQRRFGCEPREAPAILAAGDIREAMAHATKPEQVNVLRQSVGDATVKLHAAATALLDEPDAHLDAVRLGLAIYRGAVTVTTSLIDARDGGRPAGYTGFVVERHGVIRCGYSNGLRPGPCVVNGRPRHIVEVGMQSAFVELGTGDRTGDPVTLLGEQVSEADVAEAWRCTPQEALLRLCGTGVRQYLG